MRAARPAGSSAVVCLVSSFLACASARDVDSAPTPARATLSAPVSELSAALEAAASAPAAPTCAALSAGMHRVDAPTGAIHVAVPENATTCSPIYVALHGSGSSVLGVCARLAPLTKIVAGDSAPAVMLCPTGNLPYDDGVADWMGPAEARALHLDRALEHAATLLGLAPQNGSAQQGVPAVALLAGFSRGGFLARDLAYLRPGRYERLLLIGAAFMPDVTRWKESGVLGAIFAAPDFDGAATTMRHAALRTAASGLPSRFVSLGPHWHDLPEGSAQRLEESLRWSLAGANAVVGGAALGSAAGRAGATGGGPGAAHAMARDATALAPPSTFLAPATRSAPLSSR
jgi:pimeloyl-ACP methyl ester carboxylesterase